MAKTKTNLTHEQAVAALDELVAAKLTFKLAVDKFKNVYDPNTVDMSGIIDDLDETIFEIESDIDETFEDEDDE